MVDDKIVDKYWLCCNKDGSIWLTQGRKPVPSDLIMDGTWRRIHKTYDDMGWLVLNRGNYHTRKKGEIISTEDFANISFPKVTYEDGPIEIEICKSGKVYWYES